MSEQGAKPEVLPGDLITRPGLYEARCGKIVPITGWDNGWWASECNGTLEWYGSDGRRRFYEAAGADEWQLLHWVGPLPASEPEPETTTEQLAEIEGQGEQEPQPEPVQVREGRWKTRGGKIRNVTPTPEGDGREHSFPWWDAQYRQTWTSDGRYYLNKADQRDLIEYLGPIEQPEPEQKPQAETEAQPETQPQPIQVREGLWRQADGGAVFVRPTIDSPSNSWKRDRGYVWSDGARLYLDNGRHSEHETTQHDLVEYLGPIQQQSEPEPESDAELRIRLLKEANNNQAETIGQLKSEARDLNMEIGGLERQLLQRDARIRDLETIYSAATKSFEDANRANDALRAQVRILQQEADKKNSRIEFLETLNAGNGTAIDDYRAQVAKLQGLVDTARGQLEAAATERDELRAAIDAADKQLDAKDAQIRDLRIELDAAQQVPQPVSDEERERIWDEATEAAGRQVVRWLRPLTLALTRQPDERFRSFMTLTLSVLPDLLPELLGYAVEDESLDSDEDRE